MLNKVMQLEYLRARVDVKNKLEESILQEVIVRMRLEMS